MKLATETGWRGYSLVLYNKPRSRRSQGSERNSCALLVFCWLCINRDVSRTSPLGIVFQLTGRCFGPPLAELLLSNLVLSWEYSSGEYGQSLSSDASPITSIERYCTPHLKLFNWRSSYIIDYRFRICFDIVDGHAALPQLPLEGPFIAGVQTRRDTLLILLTHRLDCCNYILLAAF